MAKKEKSLQHFTLGPYPYHKFYALFALRTAQATTAAFVSTDNTLEITTTTLTLDYIRASDALKPGICFK